MRTSKLWYVLVAAPAAAGLTAAWAASPSAYQTEVNTGLVNAANSVFQNLLGSSAASVRGFNPQPDPPRIMLHLNGETVIATDIVVFYPPGPTRSTCQNVARISIENGVITLTRDIGAALELDTANLNLGALPPGPSCPSTTEIPL